MKVTDLSKTENVVKIMTELCWNAEKVNNLIANTEILEEVKAKTFYFQSRGFSAVPFFIFNDKYGISGVQLPQVLADMLSQIKEEMTAEMALVAGESCDVESGECL